VRGLPVGRQAPSTLSTRSPSAARPTGHSRRCAPSTITPRPSARATRRARGPPPGGCRRDRLRSPIIEPLDEGPPIEPAVEDFLDGTRLLTHIFPSELVTYVHAAGRASIRASKRDASPSILDPRWKRGPREVAATTAIGSTRRRPLAGERGNQV
jgi:hypothetical protein